MPQELTFSLDTFYELKGDGSPITLDVLIGDIGQSTDFNVKLASKRILEHQKESIKNFPVKSPNNEDSVDTDLIGKVLRINGNIVDMPENTNKIDLTVRLKGGTVPFPKKFSVTVEEGETVDFSIVFRFVEP
jgi:hypothetical protein